MNSRFAWGKNDIQKDKNKESGEIAPEAKDQPNAHPKGDYGPRNRLKWLVAKCQQGPNAGKPGPCPNPAVAAAIVDKPATGAEAAKPKRVKRGYPDKLPKLDPKKPPLQLLKEGDKENLIKLGNSVGMGDAAGWEEGPLGWGRMLVDKDKLLEEFGADGLQAMLDKGWVRKSTLYGSNGYREDEYAVNMDAKLARQAEIRGLDEIKVPTTRAEVDKLADVLGKEWGGDLAEKIADQLGIKKEWKANEEAHGDVDAMRPLLHEMLYRQYNPKPVWERLAGNKKLDAKAENIKGLFDKALNHSPELKAISDEIESLNGKGDVIFSEVVDLTNKINGVGEPKTDNPAPLEARLAELETQTRALGERLSVLYNQRLEARRPIKNKLLNEILAVKKPVAIKVNLQAMANHAPQEKEAVESAIGWLTGKVAAGLNGEELPEYNVVKDDSDKFGRGGPSAYYSSHDHTINVHTGMDSIRTNVHEMGHGIEYKLPGAQTAALHFLEYRVGKQPLQKLKEVLPNSGYGDWEEGRDDKFADAVGKSSAWYVGKKPSGGKGTEIISMGVEQLYIDPVNFVTRDPEYAKFILGILDGSVRDVPVP